MLSLGLDLQFLLQPRDLGRVFLLLILQLELEGRLLG